MFSRRKIADAATDVAEHLNLVESVKALRENDRKHDDSIRSLESTIWAMQAEMRVLKAETKHEAAIEVHNLSSSIHIWIDHKLDSLTARVSLLEKAISIARYLKKTSQRTLPAGLITNEMRDSARDPDPRLAPKIDPIQSDD